MTASEDRQCVSPVKTANASGCCHEKVSSSRHTSLPTSSINDFKRTQNNKIQGRSQSRQLLTHDPTEAPQTEQDSVCFGNADFVSTDVEVRLPSCPHRSCERVKGVTSMLSQANHSVGGDRRGFTCFQKIRPRGGLMPRVQLHMPCGSKQHGSIVQQSGESNSMTTSGDCPATEKSKRAQQQASLVTWRQESAIQTLPACVTPLPQCSKTLHVSQHSQCVRGQPPFIEAAAVLHAGPGPTVSGSQSLLLNGAVAGLANASQKEAQLRRTVNQCSSAQFQGRRAPELNQPSMHASEEDHDQWDVGIKAHQGIPSNSSLAQTKQRAATGEEDVALSVARLVKEVADLMASCNALVLETDLVEDMSQQTATGDGGCDLGQHMHGTHVVRPLSLACRPTRQQHFQSAGGRRGKASGGGALIVLQQASAQNGRPKNSTLISKENIQSNIYKLSLFDPSTDSWGQSQKPEIASPSGAGTAGISTHTKQQKIATKSGAMKWDAGPGELAKNEEQCKHDGHGRHVVACEKCKQGWQHIKQGPVTEGRLTGSWFGKWRELLTDDDSSSCATSSRSSCGACTHDSSTDSAFIVHQPKERPQQKIARSKANGICWRAHRGRCPWLQTDTEARSTLQVPGGDGGSLGTLRSLASSQTVCSIIHGTGHAGATRCRTKCAAQHLGSHLDTPSSRIDAAVLQVEGHNGACCEDVGNVHEKKLGLSEDTSSRGLTSCNVSCMSNSSMAPNGQDRKEHFPSSINSWVEGNTSFYSQDHRCEAGCKARLGNHSAKREELTDNVTLHMQNVCKALSARWLQHPPCGQGTAIYGRRSRGTPKLNLAACKQMLDMLVLVPQELCGGSSKRYESATQADLEL
jgi:hypothetical protein